MARNSRTSSSSSSRSSAASRSSATRSAAVGANKHASASNAARATQSATAHRPTPPTPPAAAHPPKPEPQQQAIQKPETNARGVEAKPQNVEAPRNIVNQAPIKNDHPVTQMLLDDKHFGNMMPQAATAVIPGMHFDPMKGGMVPDQPGFQVNPQVLNAMTGMAGTATVAQGPDGMPMVANPGMPAQNMPGDGQPGMYFDPMKGQMVQAAAGHVDPATGMFVPDGPNAGPNQPGMMQTPMGNFGPQGPSMHFDPMKGMMVPDPMPSTATGFPGAVPTATGGYYPPTVAVAPPMPMAPMPAAFTPQPTVFVPPAAAYYPPAAPYFPPMPPYIPPYIPPFVPPVVDEMPKSGSSVDGVSLEKIEEAVVKAQTGQGMGRATGVPEPLLMAPDGSRIQALPAGTTWEASPEGVITAKYPDGSVRVITGSPEPGAGGSMVTTLPDGTVITTTMKVDGDGNKVLTSDSSSGEHSEVNISAAGDISATKVDASGAKVDVPMDDLTKVVALATAGDSPRDMGPGDMANFDNPYGSSAGSFMPGQYIPSATGQYVEMTGNMGYTPMPTYVAPNYSVAYGMGPVNSGYQPAGMYPPIQPPYGATYMPQPYMPSAVDMTPNPGAYSPYNPPVFDPNQPMTATAPMPNFPGANVPPGKIGRAHV